MVSSPMGPEAMETGRAAATQLPAEELPQCQGGRLNAYMHPLQPAALLGILSSPLVLVRAGPLTRQQLRGEAWCMSVVGD
mmetsp:Transcript_32371/g.91733  ORF Transcript_32371/g.91733 Transcript_32371/m.91733 type:complete len:80 (+) Transcript_32371:947-1186(+)